MGASGWLHVYCLVVLSVLGLCMGSFLNCLASRLVSGESILKGRSHCMSCGHPLSVRDLIPVFSWLASGGRCRYCNEHVSARYPVTEALCAVVYVSIYLRYGLSPELLELTAFMSVLLVLSLTDLDTYVIPNGTIVAALLIRLAYLAFRFVSGGCNDLSLFTDALVGGLALAVPVLALALVMDRVLGRDSFGGGDVKLLFVAGTYFGWAQGIFLVVTACVLGLLFALLGQRKRGEENAGMIPFGPAIAAACWVTALVGDIVVKWYMGLFM